MNFNRTAYGPAVKRILDQTPGLGDLMASAPSSPTERGVYQDLFTGSAHPRGALAGLWLYLDCFDEAHKVAQEDPSREGSLWHAIAHRREPDYWNSGYWYDRVGKHPVYPAILEEAQRLGFTTGDSWAPKQFVELCEEAARPGGSRLDLALAVQRAEWEILFDYCARKRSV